MARILHPGVARFLAFTGTTLEEQAFAALPASRVPQRLTTAEQLAESERLRMRDCRHASALTRVEHTESGSRGHKQHAVTFHYADGTSQHFAPHTN